MIEQCSYNSAAKLISFGSEFSQGSSTVLGPIWKGRHAVVTLILRIWIPNPNNPIQTGPQSVFGYTDTHGFGLIPLIGKELGSLFLPIQGDLS